MRSEYIGLRVARWRDIAGMSQQDLADLVGVTPQYISMIENGRRPVTKRSLLIGLAGALGVSVTDLLGQPDDEPANRDDLAIHSAVAAVRVALDGDDDDATPPDGLETLDMDADRLIRARLACDYVAIAELLPRVIGGARYVLDSTTSRRAREIALSALVRACVYGAYAMKTAGYVDLAMRLAERSQAEALTLGDEIHMAAAHMATAQALMAAGIRRRALATATVGAEVAYDATDEDRSAAHAWHGKLMVQAALCSASLDLGDEAIQYLDAADHDARQVAGNPWNMDFSAADVAIWRMGVALENGEPERAADLAQHVDLSMVHTPQRRARFHIDRGRGLYAAGRVDDAIHALWTAHHVAPPEVRRRSTVREIVGQAVRDAKTPRGGSDELRDLARSLGIDPVAAA